MLQKSRNNNILLVDDEQDVLDVLGIHLASRGYTVHKACGPLEGIALLEEFPFFLVCTYIAMPVMDGYDFICRIKESGCESEIILMTGFGYNPDHTLVKIHSEHRYPVIFKPFEFKKPKLIEAVKAAWEEYHKDILP